MNRAAVWISVLVLALLSVIPISRTLAESFMERPDPAGPAHASLRWYDEAFVHGPLRPVEETTTQETPATRPVSARWKLLGNSVAIAGIAAIVALLLGVPYALLLARTDAPLRGVLGALYAAPLVLPPLLVAFSWTCLGEYARRQLDAPGQHLFLVDQVWAVLATFSPPPKFVADDPAAWGGVASGLRAGFLLGLCYFPLVVLFARRALSQMPASLEEAARLAGGPWLALRRVTLPLASPGILVGGLFVFLFALNDFSLVDYLNFVRPNADRISVYPYESFTAWTKNQGESVATALGAPLALVGVALLFGIQRVIGRGSRSTVTGDYRAPTPWSLGAWRWPATIAAALVLLVAAGFPVVGLALKAGGIDGYRRVWQDYVGPGTSSNEVLWTLWFCVGAAVLCLPVAFVLGHHAARTGRLRWLALAILPLALPPIFLGAGYLKILNDPAFTIGGGNPFLDSDSPRLGSMFLLVAKYVPFAIVALWAAFLEIDPRLEEAAACAGVKPLDRVLGILAPLAKPALALSVLLVFVLCLREIDTIVLLSSDTVMRRIYTMVHYQRDAEVAALCVILVLIEAIPFAAFALLTSPASGSRSRAR